MKQIIFAGLTLAMTATSALAHSKAEQTVPTDAAIVASVDAIEMRFDDPMRVTAVTLTGPDGDVEIERETGMDPVTLFRAMPPVDLPDGVYSVEWRGLSADGHPMQGRFGFTVVH